MIFAVFLSITDVSNMKYSAFASRLFFPEDALGPLFPILNSIETQTTVPVP